MVTAATGIITEIEEQWRTMLATCTYLRQWLGASSVDVAKDRIYFDSPPPPEEYADAHDKPAMVALRPFVVIWTLPENGLRLHRDSANGWDCGGRLVAQLEQNIPDEFDPAESGRLFKNTLGRILKSADSSNPGLVELAHVAPHLSLQAMEFEGPFRCPKKQVESEGDHHYAVVVAEWGLVNA